MNELQLLEKSEVEKLLSNKSVPSFGVGDTLIVHVSIKEGEKWRKQLFEGVCIARKNNSIASSFVVRKISFNEGVERRFLLYSPNIEIKVLRRGKVRRAKLYYLSKLSGKAARITERTDRIAKSV